MKILILIPARGGSEGIARKNLRSLAGRPLIAYSIQTALASRHNPDVYVSSDDEEILSIASKFGAGVCPRPDDLADGATTLDPVIYHAYQKISEEKSVEYDLIVTLQPTSPLLKTASLDVAIDSMIENESIDTVISAMDDTHLTWKKQDQQFVPNYTSRLNRQQLEPVYRETGGFLICRKRIISNTSRIGAGVQLFIVTGGEAIDIDTYEDFNLCEYYLKQKTILFVVTGNSRVGLGHVYRTLTLANRIIDHRLIFLVDKDSQLAFEKIRSYKYRVFLQQGDTLIEDIDEIKPDVVINDTLDTELEYIEALKKREIRVVTLEDLGGGAKSADLVINDLYPEKEQLPNHYFGPEYFCARDEFLLVPEKETSKRVSSILLTFGGTDPLNLTEKVLSAIYAEVQARSIDVNVVLGLGYTQHDTLARFDGISIHRNIKTMADLMYDADLIFTSAGRTIYEIACVGTPAIVMAQNERETTHFWAKGTQGYSYLGLGSNVKQEQIRDVFIQLVDNNDQREAMNKALLEKNLRQGTLSVIKLIRDVIEQEQV